MMMMMMSEPLPGGDSEAVGAKNEVETLDGVKSSSHKDSHLLLNKQ